VVCQKVAEVAAVLVVEWGWLACAVWGSAGEGVVGHL